MDFVSKEKRSNIMRGVKAKNTKPEKLVRSSLHKLGYRFRIHRKDLPGKPDICLPKYRAIILVHGCFWHHHTGCKEGRLPTSNVSFWHKKIQRNIERDKENQFSLEQAGWSVMIIWECETRNLEYLESKIQNFLPRTK